MVRNEILDEFSLCGLGLFDNGGVIGMFFLTSASLLGVRRQFDLLHEVADLLDFFLEIRALFFSLCLH